MFVDGLKTQGDAFGNAVFNKALTEFTLFGI